MVQHILDGITEPDRQGFWLYGKVLLDASLSKKCHDVDIVLFIKYLQITLVIIFIHLEKSERLIL